MIKQVFDVTLHNDQIRLLKRRHSGGCVQLIRRTFRGKLLYEFKTAELFVSAYFLAPELICIEYLHELHLYSPPYDRPRQLPLARSTNNELKVCFHPLIPWIVWIVYLGHCKHVMVEMWNLEDGTMRILSHPSTVRCGRAVWLYVNPLENCICVLVEVCKDPERALNCLLFQGKV